MTEPMHDSSVIHGPRQPEADDSQRAPRVIGAGTQVSLGAALSFAAGGLMLFVTLGGIAHAYWQGQINGLKTSFEKDQDELKTSFEKYQTELGSVLVELSGEVKAMRTVAGDLRAEIKVQATRADSIERLRDRVDRLEGRVQADTARLDRLEYQLQARAGK